MKKKVIALLMCAVLCMSGCGKTEWYDNIPSTTDRIASPTPIPVDNTAKKDEPAPTQEEVKEAEPTVEENDPNRIYPPTEYEDYTYGKAPLTSVYLLVAYSLRFSEETTMEDAGYAGMSPEEFMADMDKELTIDEDVSEEEKEDQRYEMLKYTLILSGVSDNSDEQKEGFFDGSWIPDGTDYFSEWNYGSHIGDSYEAIFYIGGIEYGCNTSVTKIDDKEGIVIYDLVTTSNYHNDKFSIGDTVTAGAVTPDVEVVDAEIVADAKDDSRGEIRVHYKYTGDGEATITYLDLCLYDNGNAVY